MGTMGYQSTPELVAAAVNAGAFACLSSVMSKTVQALREEIRKTKKLTDKPFGINMGKVLKQPPKYERMVAWHIYRNAQDVKTQRVGL